MPPRNKAQIEKAKDRADLKKERIVWIAIAATEGNMQRLSALLMFADRVEYEPPVQLGPLPWEDPKDPRYVPPPQGLDIDYEVVKRDIAKSLSALVKRDGEDATKRILESFGHARLSLYPEEALVGLASGLEQYLNPAEPKRETE